MDALGGPGALQRAKLRDLEPGTRFRLPECGKRGTLVGLGAAGARVKYDGSDLSVEIEAEESTGRKAAAFVRPAAAILISDTAVVEVLP